MRNVTPPPTPIIPGTTPTIFMQCEIDVSDCVSALFTIRCGDDILIEREKSGLTFSDGGKTVSFVPTQEESLRLPDNATIAAQLKVKLGDRVMATFKDIGKTGEALSRKEI